MASRRRAFAAVLALCAFLLCVNADASATQASGGARLIASGAGAWRMPIDAGIEGSLAGPIPGRYQFWQVGLSAGPEASGAVAMRTTIVTRVPQAVAPHTVNYFWIGAFLADGSFIQIGYSVDALNVQQAGWFYCAFTAHGDQGPCIQGPRGSAGHDGEAHTYALEATSAQPAPGKQSPAVTWSALVDGVTVGRFAWTSGTTGPHSPAVYAESSGFLARSPSSTLGPVDFTVPVQTRATARAPYVTATHLKPLYAGPEVCPPYGLAEDGHGGAMLGSGLACPRAGVWLQ